MFLLQCHLMSVGLHEICQVKVSCGFKKGKTKDMWWHQAEGQKFGSSLDVKNLTVLHIKSVQLSPLSRMFMIPAWLALSFMCWPAVSWSASKTSRELWGRKTVCTQTCYVIRPLSCCSLLSLFKQEHTSALFKGNQRCSEASPQPRTALLLCYTPYSLWAGCGVLKFRQTWFCSQECV